MPGQVSAASQSLWPKAGKALQPWRLCLLSSLIGPLSSWLPSLSVLSLAANCLHIASWLLVLLKSYCCLKFQVASASYRMLWRCLKSSRFHLGSKFCYVAPNDAPSFCWSQFNGAIASVIYGAWVLQECYDASRPSWNRCSLLTRHPAVRSMSRQNVQVVATDGSGHGQFEEVQSLLLSTSSSRTSAGLKHACSLLSLLFPALTAL